MEVGVERGIGYVPRIIILLSVVYIHT
jgi:hypothetical protein